MQRVGAAWPPQSPRLIAKGVADGTLITAGGAAVTGLGREKFAELSKLPLADATTHALALYCFSVSSREEVDTVARAALAAGGVEADGLEDYGFMCSRSFFDLDGHGWQVMWMDPTALRDGPARFVSSMQDADA